MVRWQMDDARRGRAMNKQKTVICPYAHNQHGSHISAAWAVSSLGAIHLVYRQFVFGALVLSLKNAKKERKKLADTL